MGSSRQIQLDALRREASEAVSQSTQRLRTLIGALRSAPGEHALESEPDPTLARAAVGRLDLALRGLHEISTLLDRGAAAAGDEMADLAEGQLPQPEVSIAMALLNAQEQERTRLAEELHDGPAQALANAIFQTELVERAASSDPAGAGIELARLRQLLQRELETLRAYISQLRPPVAEPEDLEEALRDAAVSLTEYTGIPVDVRFEADVGVLEVTERSVALRVAQEALRNIGKHSGAQRAWIVTSHQAQPQGGLWVMEVGDDGRGFDLSAANSGQRRRHFGLRFMRERSDLLGAQLSIESGPAAGTVVRLGISTGGERS